MNIIKKFIERLKKIGIEVELTSNVPWVYLESVNGNKVKEKQFSDHKFTIFLGPVSVETPKGIVRTYRIVEPKNTFKIIRKYVRNNKKI